jgi:hypothetical protein
MTQIIGRRTLASLTLLVALLAGAAANCAGPEDAPGMYQGGDDSAPTWRW